MPTFVKWRSCCCCCCCCVIISMKKVISDMSYRGQDFCSIDRVLVTEWRSGSEEIWMGMNSEKRWIRKTITFLLLLFTLQVHQEVFRYIEDNKQYQVRTYLHSFSLLPFFISFHFFLSFLSSCLSPCLFPVRPSFLPFHSASRPISFSSLLPPFPLAVPVPLYRLLPVPP